MTNPFFSFNHAPGQNGQSSSATFNSVKRKSRSWTAEEDEEPAQAQRRFKPLGTAKRAAHESTAPELTDGGSNSNSDTDQGIDLDEDGDQDMDMGVGMGMDARSQSQGDAEPMIVNANGHMQSHTGYAFENSGSGGFGFGPGAEEDAEDEMSSPKSNHYPMLAVYPALTAHPNPNHFLNQPPYLNQDPSQGNPFPRSKSPLSAQPFSSSLRSPRPLSQAGFGAAAGPGLFQPVMAAPLSADATEIERARSKHGPQCHSIPKLVMSQHAGVDGTKSMYSFCPDCQSLGQVA